MQSAYKKFHGYLLISDMDGTLIDSNGEISIENINAIKRFVNNGGIFTIATGRMTESARRYIHNLPIQVPAILYNGTKIYDFIKEETLFEMHLENNIKELVKKLKQYDSSLGIEIYCEEDIYIFNRCKFSERFTKKGYDIYYEIPQELWKKNWTKILILGEEDQIDKLEEEFYSVFEKANLIRSGEIFLEIVPENVSKGHAIEKLCTLLDMDISKVIAVGDNMNDFEMLTTVGYGFCVESGNKKLLNKVKYKSSSNDNHALEYVINWIEEHCLANSR